MAIYYFIPILVSLFIGTLINRFLTGIMGNPIASFPRAFFFTLSKLCWLYFLGTFFYFYDYWIVLLFIGYYFLFKWMYRVPFTRGLRFLFFSTVFSVSVQLILASHFEGIAAEFIY